LKRFGFQIVDKISIFIVFIGLDFEFTLFDSKQIDHFLIVDFEKAYFEHEFSGGKVLDRVCGMIDKSGQKAFCLF
jgi:hypothetical protein